MFLHLHLVHHHRMLPLFLMVLRLLLMVRPEGQQEEELNLKQFLLHTRWGSLQRTLPSSSSSSCGGSRWAIREGHHFRRGNLIEGASLRRTPAERDPSLRNLLVGASEVSEHSSLGGVIVRPLQRHLTCASEKENQQLYS